MPVNAEQKREEAGARVNGQASFHLGYAGIESLCRNEGNAACRSEDGEHLCAYPLDDGLVLLGCSLICLVTWRLSRLVR